MISYLSGTLLLVESPTIVLLTPAGIGYDVELPNRLFAGLPTVGSHLQLHTHLVVREDAQLLYGFLNRTDRALFRQLLKVSGVGAKLALALLGQYEAVDLIEIVLRQDKTALSKVSGVGKKTAERLVLELADRLAPLATHSPTTNDDARPEIGAALQALGYSDKEIQTALRQLAPDISLTSGIKESLQWLAKLR